MEVNKIKNLEQVLHPHLENNVTVKKYTTKQLTKSGENYGSLILAVEVLLSNNKTLNLVAKMCPPNEFLKKMFNTTLCFKKEVAMYSEIIPTLNKFQENHNIVKKLQLVPDFYGAHLNLNNNSNNDDVILLENVKIKGFRGLDRMIGFNLEETESILNNLAVLHAIPIAIKLSNPDLFEKKIKKHLVRRDMYDTISEEELTGLINFIVDILKADERCLPFLAKTEDMLRNNFYRITTTSEQREPFATISHNDLWVNNILFQVDDPKKPISLLIDFQLYDYGSPGADIIFLLFTSVQKNIFDLHYDHLIKTYHNKFIDTLSKLKSPTEMFPCELLQEEIEHAAKTTEFFHILTMMRHIFAREEKMKSIDQITIEDLTTASRQISDDYRKRLPKIVLEYSRRKWI